MKKILTFSFVMSFAVGLFAQPWPGQGTTVRSTNGFGDRTTLLNPTNTGTTTFPNGAGVSSAGVVSGNGSGLTNLALSTATADGTMGSNHFVKARTVPGWQQVELLPARGSYASGATELSVSNAMHQFTTNGLKAQGFNLMCVDTSSYQTNRNADGSLKWATNNFPSGPVGFDQLIHTNGFRWKQWYDGIASMGGASPTYAQNQADIATILSAAWARPDWIWFDRDDFQASLIVGGVIQTNAHLVNVALGMDAGVPSWESGSIANAIRVHGDTDLQDFTDLIDYMDRVETNGYWRLVRPGSWLIFGPEINAIGSNDEVSSGAVFQLMCSAGFFPVGSATLMIVATNKEAMDIQGDQAVQCARLVAVTNGAYIHLKRLHEDGQYAVSAINTNSYSTNVTFNLPALVNALGGGKQSSIRLGSGGYSVRDILTNGWVAMDATSFTVTVASHAPAMFRLYPGTAITTNYIQPPTYSATLPALVSSNGVQRIINVPWDSMVTNFVARAALTNFPDQCFYAQFITTKFKERFGTTLSNSFDCFYPNVPTSPYINLIADTFPLNSVSTVTTNSLGIAGNGSSGYFTNGFNLRSSGFAFTTNSGSIGIYSGTQSPINNRQFAGAYDGVATHITYLFKAVTDFQITINSGSLSGPGSITDFRGLMVGSRTNSTTQFGYANGTASSGSVSSGGTPNAPMFFGCWNNNGTAAGFSDVQMRTEFIGKGFTVADLDYIKAVLDEAQAILGRKAP